MEYLEAGEKNPYLSEVIIIQPEEYKKMERDIKFLGYLSACGIDNWEGYEQAQEMMDAE